MTSFFLFFCLIAESFIQVGLDGVQEVGCVDVMFIQHTPARQRRVSSIWQQLRRKCQHGQDRQTQTQTHKAAAASLGQAVDAAGQVFGHDAALHRLNAHLL